MQGLKHQAGRAGRADVDGEIAGLVGFGPEDQLTCANAAASNTGMSQLDCGLDGLLMLRP